MQKMEPASIDTEPPTLSICHMQGPVVGTTECAPWLSWASGAINDATYNELECSRHTLGKESLRESVRVLGDACTWPFSQLSARECASIRVRQVTDLRTGPWSRPVQIETGLLGPDDWTAKMIAADWHEIADRRALPLLRKDFRLSRQPASARLHVTAYGLVEPELNGVKVGADSLVPGWTDYRTRLVYRTYDVTELLQEGGNAVGAWLGNGWYRGRIGYLGGRPDVYGSEVGLLMQLEIRFEDESFETVVSDETWRAWRSPVLLGELLGGETYDARLLPVGWSNYGFDDSSWLPVRTLKCDYTTLCNPIMPSVRSIEELKPVSIESKGDGRYLCDFGQNCAGRIRIRVQAQRGTEITIRHAEVLQQGELYTRPLRGATSTDIYICTGTGVEEWEPRFTIHGFRYAEISGYPKYLDAESVRAVVYHSDMERIGWFQCSDTSLNRLHDNAVWSMRSNFVSIPTDCPQRDERLGWTGDIAVFSATAAFLYECTGVLSSWLSDLASEQREFGTVPYYVPYVPFGRWGSPLPFAVWGDAAVIVPWELYFSTGDKDILVKHYESAAAWVDQVAGLLHDGVWDVGMQLGDWLDPAAPPDTPAAARTDPHLVATAYAANSATLVHRMAKILGKKEDCSRFEVLSKTIREGFRHRYVLPGGSLRSDTQTAYAMAIVFDLLANQGSVANAGQRLSELVEKAGGRIATGFAGTPIVCEALTKTGHYSCAYKLVCCTDCPSWLYQISMGATTTWERWDSMLPDGTVNPGQMTSFNHYAFGAIANWMHSTIGGLSPESPGYKVVRIAPRPGGGLKSARVAHRSPHGLTSVSWTLNDRDLKVQVDLPTDTSGIVDLPGSPHTRLDPGVHVFHVLLPLDWSSN